MQEQKPRVHIDAPADKLRRLRELQKVAAERERTLVVAERRELLEKCPHPLALAMYLDDTVVSVPAMEYVSKQMVENLHNPNGRLTLSLPSQIGKTFTTRWFILWALLDDPNRRCVFASFSMLLARTSGRIVRSYVTQYGGPYGLELDEAHHDASDWQLKGFDGGLLSATPESTLTGRPSDCIAGSSLVRTPSGDVKAEEVQPGDLVLTLNHDTGAQEPRRVLATRQIDSRPVIDVTMTAGGVLRCTADHRVHTAAGYQPAGSLRLGTELTNTDGDPASVVSVFPAGRETVYDLQVDGNANFYANGVLVHNCMILDDLHSGEAEANSTTMRDRVETWWESTARTRMAPGTPALAIGTRFSYRDILSKFINDGWGRINVPALADGKETLDSVAHIPEARTEDGYLITTRGHTPNDWRGLREEVGERAWSSLAIGSPVPVEGGVYLTAWFDAHKQDELKEAPTLTAVFVDPAETGTGDAAGILVAARTKDARVAVLADYTEKLSSAKWGRKVCLAWMEWDANRVVQERTLGLASTIPDAWSILHRQATALGNVGIAKSEEERAALALDALHAAGDSVAADWGQLAELAPHWQGILDRGSHGPRVVTVTPKMSKRARAESVSSAWETGRAFLVGNFPELIWEAVTWSGPNSGQKSPNRLDTMVMATAYLEQAGGKASVSRRPRHLQAVPTATVTTLAR